MSKKLLNAPGDAVVEMLEGLVASQDHLRRLDGFPHVRLCCWLALHQVCESIGVVSWTWKQAVVLSAAVVRI